jgi:hypothetical protein
VCAIEFSNQCLIACPAQNKKIKEMDRPATTLVLRLLECMVQQQPSKKSFVVSRLIHTTNSRRKQLNHRIKER